MKRLSKIGLMLGLAGFLFLSSCAGTYYVTAQPVEPVYERPAPPWGGAIWIDGEWTWSGGTYVYTRGYWEHPRPGHVWVRGSWERGSRGYRWHRGHWS